MAPVGDKLLSQRIRYGENISEIIQLYNDRNAKLALHDYENNWYHGKLTRGNAIHIIKKRGSGQGSFLVRESVNIPGSFVLSLSHNEDTQHFQINSSPHSGCFSIDNGPPFVGLDELIRFYKSGANGLPTKLVGACSGHPVPPHLKQYGEDTIIHQAVDEQLDTVNFRKILSNPKKPHLDIRNKDGLTALQAACKRGLNDLVLELYNNGADIKTRDADGGSALHIVCQACHPETCKILVKYCHAKPQDRYCVTGWVPLHTAAYYGNAKCIETLLQLGTACNPRCVGKGETPIMLAKRNNKKACVQILENFQPPPPIFNPSQWLCKTIDRQKAVEFLESKGLADGLFLVRASKRVPGQFVLTMSFNKTVYNYEIKSKNSKWFFIDDGPLFSGVESLVDYYCRYSDGLPSSLYMPINAPISRNPKVDNRPPAPLPAKNNQKVTSPTFSGFPHAQMQMEPRIIDSKDIQLGRELGQGEFGSVLMGVLKGDNDKMIPVALKTLHGEHINTGETEFMREAEVMMGLDHPCIVRLFGICRGETLMMVQELVAMGSALDFILDYPHSLDLTDFKLWAAQIASGMTYLEEKRFVHRDLALRNILLSSKQLIKISDFGLSRAVGAGSNYYKASAGGRWPVKWYAPESINYGTFSSASDVWSYGITLWEIFSKGEQPYGTMSGAQVIQFVEGSKRRLPKPEGCPEKVYKIMLNCWEYETDNRPTFRRLHHKFRSDPEYFNMQVPGHKNAT